MSSYPFPDDDPATIRHVAEHFRTIATSTTTTADAVGTLSGQLATTWSGQYGAGVAHSVATLAGKLRRPVDPLGAAADALETYAGVLDQARTDVLAVRDDHDDAVADRTRALDDPPEGFTGKALQMYRYEIDEGYSARMSGIRADHDAILETVDDAARVLGAELEALTDGATQYLDVDAPPLNSLGPDGFDGGDWVPQGFTYDPVTGLFVETAYDIETGDTGTEHPSVITLTDGATGDEERSVQLGGLPGGDGPGKTGGVTVNGDDVYVIGSDGAVYRYSMDDIRAVDSGGTVDARGRTEVGNTSYVTHHDGSLYVGDFDKDEAGSLYRYELDHDGDPIVVDPADALVTRTPKQVQGVTFHDGHYVYSQSYGRYAESYVSTQPEGTDGREYVDDPDGNRVVRLPNMSEGIVRVGDRIVVSHESGADHYQGHRGASLIGKHTDPRDDASSVHVDELD